MLNSFPSSSTSAKNNKNSRILIKTKVIMLPRKHLKSTIIIKTVGSKSMLQRSERKRLIVQKDGLKKMSNNKAQLRIKKIVSIS